MATGPRLVIPGTIFGCMILVVLLVAVTASASYSPPLLSDSAAAEQLSSNLSEEAAGSTSPFMDGAQLSAANSMSGECAISNKFPDKILQWCGLITDYSQKRGLSPDLIAALIWQESGGNPSAYSKSGAVGLMQVMPRDGLASNFMCISGPCFTNRPTIQELEDPEFNVKYGTQMLQELIDNTGDTREALKSYGPKDVGYYYADKVLGIYQQYGSMQ